MNDQHIGIIIGGFIPALLFGVEGFLFKCTDRAGISPNYFILFVGIGVLIVGIISFWIFDIRKVNILSASLSMLTGATWAFAVVLISFSIYRYGTPISIISVLAAGACVVTVILAMIFFAEWKELNLIKISIGTILVIVGGALISTANI